MEAAVQTIHIKPLHHDREDDWSVESDGRLHKHVATTTEDQLVEYPVVAAQQVLLGPEALADRVEICFSE
jgi:hypothetical protein